MNATSKKQLFQLLKSIEGNGTFVTSGVQNFGFPGLHVEGVGELAMPMLDFQIKELLAVAKQAPFGRGSETITDTNVRKTWEIDASKISFKNPDWEVAFNRIKNKAKKGLGLEDYDIKASLYKLLIYEEGGFFLPHKDSEKEPGMFGTLVVGVPSKHTGGELFVRFDGKEEVADFSVATSNYKMPFVAFYADCEHEIKPVTSGYRVCLVYNLVQEGSAIKSPHFATQAEDIAELLSDWKIKESFPKAILLEHEYTPANFAVSSLKRHDLPRAEALLAAAEKAGYFAKLGLVTHYQMGQLEDVGYGGYSRRRRSRYYYDEEEEDLSGGTMGEIYEDYTKIEHWENEGSDVPQIGELHIDQSDIIGQKEIGAGEPTQKEAEGYTGNAGMTMEYWYHYGAVVLWPKHKHFDFLMTRNFDVRSKWLNYYIEHLDDEEQRSREYLEQFVQSLDENVLADKDSFRFSETDYSAVAYALVRLEDEKFLKAHGISKLKHVFDRVGIPNWLGLLQQYNPMQFHAIFEQAGKSKNLKTVQHLVSVLEAALQLKEKHLIPFLNTQIDALPSHLKVTPLHELNTSRNYYMQDATQEKPSSRIVKKVVEIAAYKTEDAAWTGSILEHIIKKMPRQYVNTILVPIVLSSDSTKVELLEGIKMACTADLTKRVNNKPQPPSNWTREVPPMTGYYGKVWQLLKAFLESPTEKVFDYAKRQADRSVVESAIKNVTIDLKTETIKRGSPHTLRITKTQAAYKRKLKAWNEDVALLEQLN